MSSNASLASATSLQTEQLVSSVLRSKTIAPLHNLPRRPPIPTRTWTSPPLSPTSSARDMAAALEVPSDGGAFTPPATPTGLRRSSSADRLFDMTLMTPELKRSDGNKLANLTPFESRRKGSFKQKEDIPLPPSQPLEFTSAFTPLPRTSNRDQEYGRGIWSIVIKATLSSSFLLTPPNSPEALSCTSQALAVKSPLHRESESVLRSEAIMLTHLSRIPSFDQHVVPFHGYHSPSSSIVLSAIPLTLINYVSMASSKARANFSTRTMFDPVLGNPAWLLLAHQLVSSLSWLHNTASVIHSDVKPGNILLRPTNKDNSPFPYEALLTDFSSSFHFTSAPVASSLALTTSFAAPELLVKHSTAAPSKSSDVYALGCTLLAAATGDLLIYPTQYEIQRLTMAREGIPLEFVRMGNQGSRVRKGGLVERVVVTAAVKEPSSRIEAGQWLGRVEEIMRKEGIVI